ncbi:MAG: hypothetical protein ACI4K9_08715 [Candidatus Fimenecus sp.]
MQKKSVKIGKSITAVLLCVILLATSLPFAMAAGGAYNPAPTFADDATENIAAYLTDDGGIVMTFPQATANTERKEKSVAGYILELVDLGEYDTMHIDNLLLRKSVTPSGEAPYIASFTVEEIRGVLPDGLDETHRYNVTVKAYDTEGWVSEALDTIVSDVPYYSYDAERYAPLSADAHAMREMLTFEASSPSNTEVVQTGDTITISGRTEQTGAEGASNKDSYAFRFRINSQATEENPQTFDTSYSRQTWDFQGAEEVWFWMDLRQVSITGLSFRLRANEKILTGYASGKTADLEQADNIGETVYSTRGTAAATYTGEAPYVYLQRDDGGWEKTYLSEDGTIDLANFTGYIRVPLQFMCSETDTYVNTLNTEFGTDKSDLVAKVWNVGNSSAQAEGTAQTEANVDAYIATLKTASDVLLDAAGTPVTEALLVQNRNFKCSAYRDGIGLGSYGTVFRTLGKMPAAGIDLDDGSVTATTNTKRATYNGTTFDRTDETYRAVNDLYSAGFSYTGVSADSIDKSFFLDNVLFYRTDGGEYTANTIDGNASNTGNLVSDYYNQSMEVARAIFYECELLISDPDWSDYRQVDYIEDLIEGYKQVYSEAGVDISFLEEDALTAAASTLNMSEAWNNFLTAREECKTYNTYGKRNNAANELVPDLERALDDCPDPSTLLSASDTLTESIKHLQQIYRRLNRAQLEALGSEEEQKLLSYVLYLEDLLSDNSFVVGQQLASNSFVLFNDFENEPVGKMAWQLENDPVVTSEDVGNDYRYKKGFLSYTTTLRDFVAQNRDEVNYFGGISRDPTKEGLANAGNLKVDAMHATVTQDGVNGTNAASVTVDAQYYQESPSGFFNILSVTYNGAEADTYDELRANNMSAVKLGDLAKNASGLVYPLSLIFYVDFSELENFKFGTSISSYVDGSPEDYAPDMGTSAVNQHYFLLDPDTGEWLYCENAGSPYCWYSDTVTNEKGITLDHYKGYLMVPLYHFKKSNTGGNLDQNAEALNNIYRVMFGIAPRNADAAASLDGKTFVIDNIGFGYGNDDYPTREGVESVNYDELFGVKSVAAQKFEDLVASIDPYDSSTFSDQMDEALQLYASLTEYQKTRESTKRACTLYSTYLNWLNSGIPEDHKPLLTVAELTEKVNALPAAVKVDPGALPNPGFTDDDSAVNYDAFGITAEQTDEIIEYYEKTYAFLPGSEKTSMGDAATDLENAYKAAKRCKALETMLADMQSVQSGVTNLYIKNDVDVSLMSISSENRGKLQDFQEQFNEMSYFAKAELEASPLGNIPRAVIRVLANTETYTFDNSAVTLDGGVLQLLDKYETLYTSTKQKIDNRELFTDAELQELQDTIDEYDALIPAYHDIQELYDVIQAILALFPVDDTTSESESVLLSEEHLSGSASYEIAYSEQLPLPTDANYVTITSANGALVNALTVTTAVYNIQLITPDGTLNKTSSDLTTALRLGDVENNAYTAAAPWKVTVNISLSTAPVAAYELSDVLTINYYKADGTPVTDASGNALTKTITVSYASGDAYAVTYPADISVSWGDTDAQDAHYTVTSVLQDGAKLTVSAAANDGGAMTNANGSTLHFTVLNGEEQQFTGNNDSVASSTKVQVSDFSGVPLDNYTGTMTYTVTYTPAP